jgi:hypothetical protein
MPGRAIAVGHARARSTLGDDEERALPGVFRLRGITADFMMTNVIVATVTTRICIINSSS